MDKFNYILYIMEKKYPSIYKHSERVAMMCYEFSKKFDLDGTDTETLYVAGFLHEVGKCNFNEDIVIDGREIKAEEFYPLFSKAITAMILDDERIAKIVGQHLENSDGTGHPLGLHDKDIHLFATMVHICDYYDHCRMEGDTHNGATAKLRKQADIMFPKKMITPFIKMLVNDDSLDFYKK